MTENAHRFRHLLEEHGITIDQLGCIMATVEPIPVLDYMLSALANPAADLYKSSDLARFWIDGDVGARKAHVTILYGLLKPGPEIREHVDELLDDIDLASVEVDHVGMFDSPYPDEPYKCIVAHLRITPELALAHARLSYLPHINTFPEYRAHVTLAYVKDEPAIGTPWARTIPEAWVRALNQDLAGRRLRVTGIDYGGNKEHA